MLPGWCSERCCPPEADVSCESARALFGVLSIGGCCDHAEKLQSITGRHRQISFPRPRTRLSFAERADISCVHLRPSMSLIRFDVVTALSDTYLSRSRIVSRTR